MIHVWFWLRKDLVLKHILRDNTSLSWEVHGWSTYLRNLKILFLIWTYLGDNMLNWIKLLCMFYDVGEINLCKSQTVDWWLKCKDNICGRVLGLFPIIWHYSSHLFVLVGLELTFALLVVCFWASPPRWKDHCWPRRGPSRWDRGRLWGVIQRRRGLTNVVEAWLTIFL